MKKHPQFDENAQCVIYAISCPSTIPVFNYFSFWPEYYEVILMNNTTTAIMSILIICIQVYVVLKNVSPSNLNVYKCSISCISRLVTKYILANYLFNSVPGCTKHLGMFRLFKA